MILKNTKEIHCSVDVHSFVITIIIIRPNSWNTIITKLSRHFQSSAIRLSVCVVGTVIMMKVKFLLTFSVDNDSWFNLDIEAIFLLIPWMVEDEDNVDDK